MIEYDSRIRHLSAFIHSHKIDMGEEYNCLDFAISCMEILGVETGLTEKMVMSEERFNFKIKKSKENFHYLLGISQKTKMPQDGDLVLLAAHFRRCHVGVWFDKKTLHYDRGRGVMFHDLKKLRQNGYYIEGFYNVKNKKG